ncbi:MAG: hypothetical protein IJR34_06980 [Bacteroidales bacterium]|nr:hypothetical protein [Bacteroidales bacterium]
MRAFFIIRLACLSVLLCGCHSLGTVSYAPLEQAIRLREQYLVAFEERMDSLKAQDSFDALFAAFEAYSNFNMDSVKICASRLEPLASSYREQALVLCVRSVLLVSHREYGRAWDLLDRVESARLDAGAYLTVLHHKRDVCMAASNDASLPQVMKEEYAARRMAAQRQILDSEGLSDYQRLYFQGKMKVEQGSVPEALTCFHQAMEICPDDENRIHLYYAIAGCYGQLGRRDEWKRWLIETAVLDLKCCHRKYRSLYDLSRALYEDGDYSRADRYLQITLADALACNFDTRIINATTATGIVTEAIREREKQHRRLRLLFMLVILSALAGSVFSMLKINRQRKRLKSLLRQLREINARLKLSQQQLQESDMLKQRYLFRYMLLSAQFVENINEYRLTISRTLKEQGPDRTRERLRDVEYVYMQYDSFYRLFDEIFLGIFPDFVSQVNQLLSPDGQVGLTERGALSTELRILAVIRLGMKKSGEIARFLNVSPNTVYTYRAALKKASLVGEDAFEERVIHLLRGE